MNEPFSEEFEARFESYLDGLADGPERDEIEALIKQHPELQRRVAADRELRQRLQSAFAVPPVPADSLPGDKQPERRPVSKAGGFWRSPRTLMTLAASAVILCGIFTWWSRPSRRLPAFAQRPLVEVYQEAVNDGFRPYYYCDDPERFAATFKKRQGVAVQLQPMPEDRRMLGLSYPGGTSRDSTGILCESQGQPVMVIVDRQEHDGPHLVDKADAVGYVHRRERAGLIFYEVSPLAQPTILDYLTVE